MALAHEDSADDGWRAPPTTIPPATASLALMAAAAEQETVNSLATPQAEAEHHLTDVPLLMLPVPDDDRAAPLPLASAEKATRRLRRTSRPATRQPTTDEGELRQIPLF